MRLQQSDFPGHRGASTAKALVWALWVSSAVLAFREGQVVGVTRW